MRICGLFSCQGRRSKIQMDKDFDMEKCTERGSLWLQFAAATSACFALMACGGHLGWTSPALEYLKKPESEIPISKEQASWIAALYTFGSVFGSVLSPFVVDRLGRKISLLGFSLPQLSGWFLIIFANSYKTLYVARFVAGIAHGGFYNIAIIYLAEIADKDIRGAFGTLLKMSTNLGTLFVTTAGAYLTYDRLNLVSLILPLAFACTFIFMPETPYFYLIKNREDRATESLLKLRRLSKPDSVSKDIELMREAVEEGQRSKRGALKELFMNPGNRRGLWILLSLKVTQQMSGHMAIVAYTQEIFSHGGSETAAKYGVILLGICQLVAGIAAASLIDKLGRRILILISGTSATVALFFVGFFFYMKYGLLKDVSLITWLPFAAVIMYEIVVALGIGTIPYVILGEIFPTNVKGAAVSFGMIIGSFLATVVGLEFQAFNSIVGIYGTFWFFALCCLFGTLWAYKITPETKGKTLEEIQDIFNPKRKEEKMLEKV